MKHKSMFAGGRGMKIGLALLSVLMTVTSHAQDRSPAGEASWMLNRLAGVRFPADSPVLAEMTRLISAGDRRGAAAIATQQSQFYSVTVKEMAAKMSTREESIATPLNDFTAAVIGVTRDETDSRELLYGDFYYMGDPARVPTTVPSNLNTDLLLSNNHYFALERANLDLAGTLIRVAGQRIPTSATANVANPDPGGVLTSHTFLAAHAIAGTNRRLVEYSFRQFMCTPMVGMADTGAPDVRIGRDVTRQPGGDAMTFQNSCKGCHSVMDGFRGAFAKWDYIAGLSNAPQTAGGALHVANGVTTGNFAPTVDTANRGVIRKLNKPDTIAFPLGFVSTDDSFVNFATRGVNGTRFGFRGMAPDASALAGATGGVHAFGRLLANSQQYSRCWAQRVFAQVCKHDLSDTEADILYASLALDFEKANYNLKKLFQIVATHPKCRI